MNFSKTSLPVCFAAAWLGFAPSGHSQSFLTNGLVLYYPFNGNAKDASGHGNDGTVQGATLTTSRFGIPNNAYSFNGTSSMIQVPETFLSSTNDAWTVSIWVTTDNQPYNVQVELFQKSSVNGAMGLGILPGGFYSCGAYLPGMWYVANSPTPVHSNSLAHVVGVYQKGQSLSLYLNGVLTTNVSLPNENLVVDSFPLLSALGAYDYTPAPYEWFHGRLEDFRVYTRALSALEVQQLYAIESVPPVCVPHAATATPVLVNGFVVGANIIDPGCGYTNTPQVLISGGGGTGATASAVVSNGVVVSLTITDAGINYTNTPTISIGSPLGIQISLIKAVAPSFSNLLTGANYQLQVSGDLTHWTNQGPVFTATNSTTIYSQYFNVDNGNQLYFRLQTAP